MNKKPMSEFRKVKASATLTLTEFTDGTVECVPTYDPAVDLTTASHSMVNAIYEDIINLVNPKEEKKDETSNEHSTTK